MSSEDVSRNVSLMLLCYAYIVVIIVISGRLNRIFHISQKASRKFLHAMIGNLPFVIPFFTASVYPALVAAPFILVTFIASPLSPFKNLSKKMKGLSEITEEGHHLGLVFYAVSYTVLALLFASKPYIIAAGILPMAYGDSIASLIGERFGKTKYKLTASRSLEGSAAMFLICFVTVVLSLAFFSAFYQLLTLNWIVTALAVAAATTVIEAISPKGSDNLTVPAIGALTLLLITGGI
jgi:dolichol kinase